MPLTNFPNGITSFGIPIVGGNNAPFKPYATYYFVDGNNFTQNASDGNEGTSPEEPLSTMARAFAILLSKASGGSGGSGSVICFIGNITEQLTTPAGVFDVTIIGCGNSPRNADLHTTLGGYSAATWKAPSSPTASTPLLTIQQQGWTFMNFLFGAAPAATPSVDLFRDGGAGSAERDASHAAFYGMRFDGSPIGIRANGGPAFITIANSLFARATTTAIANTTGAGIGTNLNWNIINNRFFDNVNHIVLPANQCTIYGNTMGNFTTMSIDLQNGIGNNMVWGNLLTGTYSIAGGYRAAAATDNWAGNYSNDAGVTTVLTQADPA
jgi:hypothetical protein